MTREEAIRELEILKDDYWDDDGYGHETKQYDDTMLALDMAIKALEREPVLDKISAEIEQVEIVYDKSPDYKDNRTDAEKASDLWKMCKLLVLDILDKYKGEREGKNE